MIMITILITYYGQNKAPIKGLIVGLYIGYASIVLSCSLSLHNIKPKYKRHNKGIILLADENNNPTRMGVKYFIDKIPYLVRLCIS